jgi:hypothetical protein
MCNQDKQDNEFPTAPKVMGKSTELCSCEPCAKERAWVESFPAPMGCVYLVKGGDLWKIGFTERLAKRLASLRTMSPVPLTLEHVWAGTIHHETAFHQRYRRKRHHGEWFDLSDEQAVKLVRGGLAPITRPGRKQLPTTPRLLRS